MDWMMILKYFITISGGSAAIVYLSKKIRDKTLDLALESYKGELSKQLETHKSNLEKEVLEYKVQIEKTAIEHTIKYGKLHEKRGQIIKKIYRMLYELQMSLSRLTTMVQGPEWITDTEREQDSREKLESLKERMEINSLYFNDEICRDIDDIIEKAWTIIFEMHKAKKKEQLNQALLGRGRYVVPDELAEPIDKWIKQEDEVRITIKSLRKKLLDQFRKLLGVESDE